MRFCNSFKPARFEIRLINRRSYSYLEWFKHTRGLIWLSQGIINVHGKAHLVPRTNMATWLLDHKFLLNCDRSWRRAGPIFGRPGDKIISSTNTWQSGESDNNGNCSSLLCALLLDHLPPLFAPMLDRAHYILNIYANVHQNFKTQLHELFQHFHFHPSLSCWI